MGVDTIPENTENRDLPVVVAESSRTFTKHQMLLIVLNLLAATYLSTEIGGAIGAAQAEELIRKDRDRLREQNEMITRQRAAELADQLRAEKEKTRKKEIYELPFAQNMDSDISPYYDGKTFEAAVEDQRTWLLNYIQSPMYLEILKKQIRLQAGLGGREIDETFISNEARRIINARLQRVRGAQVHFRYDLKDPENPKRPVYGYAITDTSGSANIYISTHLSPREPATAAHEFKHVAEGNIDHHDYSFPLQYPQVAQYLSALAMGRELEYVKTHLEYSQGIQKGAQKYEFRSWEIESFVTELKYYADLFDIMDPLTEEFTLEHYRFLKKTMIKFLPRDSYLQMYFNGIPEENVVELFNSVAYEEPHDSDVGSSRDS